MKGKGIRARIGHAVDQIKDWWSGDYVPYDNDPNSPVVFIGGWHRRPWIATTIEAALAWALRNGWNVTFTLIGLVGLWLAYLALV